MHAFSVQEMSLTGCDHIFVRNAYIAGLKSIYDIYQTWADDLSHNLDLPLAICITAAAPLGNLKLLEAVLTIRLRRDVMYAASIIFFFSAHSIFHWTSVG